MAMLKSSKLAALLRWPKRRPIRTAQKARFYHPCIDLLEDRMVLSTFFVTNTDDAGAGSFRQAILDANSHANTLNPGNVADAIHFNIAGAGIHSINAGTQLPTISEAVVIDGYTQSGAAQATATTSAIIKIRLFRVPEVGTANGLVISSAGSTVRGLMITDFSNTGIHITGPAATGNVIAGNWIGTGVAGANGNGVGIRIDAGATGNTIGGTTVADRNVISDNLGDGVLIIGAGTSNNTILGNFIGTDATGTADLGNAVGGILIQDASNNLIGGTTAAARNVISGNNNRGINIQGNSSNNVVQGNYIGTDVTGTQRLGNAFTGVEIAGGNNNIIGGTAAGAGNVISANGHQGVAFFNGANANLLQGNLIGTDLTGLGDLGNNANGVLLFANATNNLIGGTVAGARNIISGNGVLGVYIDGVGSTGNTLQGNYIGTDFLGEFAIANASGGVEIDTASNNFIGGSAPGAGNLISGNQGIGIKLDNSSPGVITHNTVQGNYIGTDRAGSYAIANNSRGIEVTSDQNVIGGDIPGAGNLISGNAHQGILVFGSADTIVQGNFIGTNRQGTSAVANGLVGISIVGGSTNTLVGGTSIAARNLISGNAQDGIYLQANDNSILGNFIGTDVTGSAPIANEGHGIRIVANAVNNSIGGPFAGAGNVISGNEGSGIGTNASSNTIQGNYIGTDATGTQRLGNAFIGVEIAGGSNNLIGGTAPGAGNVISANGNQGVAFYNGANANLLQGNLIGTDRTGFGELGNDANGVLLYANATNNLIGGTVAGARNIISGNGVLGVFMDGQGTTGNRLQGNYIGTDRLGEFAIGNGGGVEIDTASNNFIGGSAPGAGNLISGNHAIGVKLDNSVPGVITRNTVQGNFIGTDRHGINPIANAARGIEVTSDENVIGGGVPGAGNLISGNDDHGILVFNSRGTVIQGNRVGTDINGERAIPNFYQGISVVGGSRDTIVGGTSANERNLLSGNRWFGLYIQGEDTTVLGNYIGTNATGTGPIGNTGGGIGVEFASDLRIGGPNAGAGNLISGNVGHGIDFNQVSFSTIQGNRIGVNAAGSAALNNVNLGVFMRGASTNNLIGGTTSAERNVVSGNARGQIRIEDVTSNDNRIEGNYIGTDATGSYAIESQRVLLSTMQSGSALLSNPNITFFETGIAAESAADFTSGAAGNTNFLFLWDLLPADGRGELRFSITIDYTPLTTDNDFIFGLTDGVNIVGWERAENNGGSWFTRVGAYNGVNVPGFEARDTGLGVVAPFTLEYTLSRHPGDPTKFRITEGSNSHDEIFSSFELDGDRALQFFLAREGTNEDYRVHSVSISIVEVTYEAGINLAGTSENIIGGATPGAGNLISGNTGEGIVIEGDDNRVQGNFIGTDATGLLALGNQQDGVSIRRGSGNLIGGIDANMRNVIAGSVFGNSVGIVGFDTFGNTIQGNFLGTDRTGNVPLLYSTAYAGIGMGGGSHDNLIGGTGSNDANVIVGPTHAVVIHDGYDNTLQRNTIGVGANGITPLNPNLDTAVRLDFGSTGNEIRNNRIAFGDVGVFSGNNTSNTIDGNTIDHMDQDAIVLYLPLPSTVTNNFIRDNNRYGIVLLGNGAVVTGNTIHDNAAAGVLVNNVPGDLLGVGNRISQNAIFNNGGLGIDLGEDGVTFNDVNDLDAGANNRQNFPRITEVRTVGADTSIGALLNSTPNTTYRIEFFASAAADPSGHGEGQLYLGSVDVTTDDFGNAAATFNYIGALPFIHLSTTATNLATGDTSEFGPNIFNPLVVTTTADTIASDGFISFREALIHANARAGTDTIAFDIPGLGVQTINVTSGLPTITDSVLIDGFTQFEGPITESGGVLPMIELRGAGAGNAEGIHITAANVTLRGFIVNQFGRNGILIDGPAATNVRIQGNYIGTDATGTFGRANLGFGVSIRNGASNNLIGTDGDGTSDESERNVLSGNLRGGIVLSEVGSNANVIAGNIIGLGATGSNAVPNGTWGVGINQAANTLVGGDLPIERNVISANTEGGVFVIGLEAVGTVIRGNYIGTDLTGLLARGNTFSGVYTGSASGFFLDGLPLATGAASRTTIRDNLISGGNTLGIWINGDGASNNAVFGNRIGTDAAGNVGLGNLFDGIHLSNGASNNRIGTDADGLNDAAERNVIHGSTRAGIAIQHSATVGNRIQGNAIYNNGSLGIDLGIDGATANDASDADTGANQLQNYPVITEVGRAGGNVVISASLNSTPNTTFRVEFFANEKLDASGFGEGQQFLGAVNVRTDLFGNALAMFTNIGALPFSYFAATATNLATGDTSEFGSMLMLDPLVVTTTADTVASDGVTSLREAITYANSHAGTDTISFNIPGAGVHTIRPTISFPIITDTVIIDGYTQPGASPNSNPLALGAGALGTNAVLKIEIDGSLRTTGLGLLIVGQSFTNLAQNSVFRGLVINQSHSSGIDIYAPNVVVEGNFIGTDPTGTMARPNADVGVSSAFWADNARIGGTTPAARNVISGNLRTGVLVQSSGHIIQSNFIGTDATGTVDLGNGENGVIVNTSMFGVVRNDVRILGNLISGNTGSGINANLHQNGVIQGNFIGTNLTGTAAIGNGTNGVFDAGIFIGLGLNTSSVLIGGPNASDRNVISGNAGNGILFVASGTGHTLTIQNNFVGLQADGSSSLGNTRNGLWDGVNGGSSEWGAGGIAVIRDNRIAFNTLSGAAVGGVGTSFTQNAIYSNGSLGIDVGPGGVTLPGVPVAPVLTGFTINGNNASITGSITGGLPIDIYRIEFFSNPNRDASGYGEGQSYLGSMTVVTDSFGEAIFSTTLIGVPVVGSHISMTATQGDRTSEFSATNVSPILNLAGNPVLDAVTSDANPGTLVSDLINRALYTDDNTTDIRGIVITAREETNGTWQYSLNGTTWLPVQDVSGLHRHLIADATTRVRFVPDSGFFGSANFSFRAWDGTNGIANGGIANASAGGNPTAYSVAVETATVLVATNLFIVTNTNDSGVGSLRQAIINANAHANTLNPGGIADQITFAIPGTGVQTIRPTAPLPNVTDAVIIDGYSQPGSTPNTNALTLGDGALGSNAVLNIEIDGSLNPTATLLAIGNLFSNVGANSVVRGLVLNNSRGNGLDVWASGVVVEGNFIGVDPAGMIAKPNAGYGVLAASWTANNRIGGTTSASRNVIAGNRDHNISANGFNQLIQGNFIGTNAAGTAGFSFTTGSQAGILLGMVNPAGPGHTVLNNLISGNYHDGIRVTSPNTIVRGNFVGTNLTGLAALPNNTSGNGDGIHVFFSGAGTVAIGGPAAADRNIISGNIGNGLSYDSTTGVTNTLIIENNYIGLKTDGVSALSNQRNGIYDGNLSGLATVTTIRNNRVAYNLFSGAHINGQALLTQNSIYSNAGLGIDKDVPGVSAGYPIPTITALVDNGATLTLSGTMQGSANTAYVLEFFASEARDPSGYGEGQTYLGSTSVTTNAAGLATFTNLVVPNVVPSHLFVSGTATQTTNTFEFGPVFNARPTVSDIANQSGVSGAAVGPISFTVGDRETNPALLVVSATSSNTTLVPNTNIVVTGSGSNRSITVTPAANQTGTAIITVQVIDAQGGIGSDTFSIDVYGNLTVINTNDSGAGSLRQAILNANARSNALNPGGIADVITFAIPGTSVHTIRPLSPLPAITDTVVIDGYTQAGASANTNALTLGAGALGTNAVLKIEIDGSLNPFSDLFVFGGLFSTLGSNSAIRGLVINQFRGDAISIQTNNVTVEGNFIGVDPTGTAARPHPTTVGNGVGIAYWATGARIGGTTPASRNLISGTANAVYTQNSNHLVQGNFLGTNADGTAAIGNINGISVTGRIDSFGNLFASDNVQVLNNLVSGNTGVGISFGYATNGIIRGNFIGTNRTGTGAIANSSPGSGSAVHLQTGGVTPNNSITLGGPLPQHRNVISGNSANGVTFYNAAGTGHTILIENNEIGTQADGASPLGNTNNGLWDSNGNNTGLNVTVRNNRIAFNGFAGAHIVANGLVAFTQNAIFSNSALGIDREAPGVSINPNVPFPVLTSVADAGANLLLSGTLQGLANRTYNLEFFSSAERDPSGYGEGQTYLGTFSVTTNASGLATFSNQSVANVVPSQLFISGTATESGVNRTSEFGPVYNAMPTISDIANQSGLSGVAVGPLNFTVGDRESSAASLSVTAGSNNTTLIPSANITLGGSGVNRTITVTPAANQSGTAIITVTVTDAHGGVTIDTFTVNVTANFVVTNTNDSGAGSLRQAILNANAHANTLNPGGVADVITFAIPGIGVQTISPLSALPGITQPVVIDATTQPGFADSPLIELNGASAGAGVDGFAIQTNNSTIRGFIINGFKVDGISIAGSNNVIAGNWIGIASDGITPRSNENEGVHVIGINSNNNVIGGTHATDRNVISGHTFYGIGVNGSNFGTRIVGNYIGTDPTGTIAVPNGWGIVINGANSIIGGATAAERNVISGNQIGVHVGFSFGTGNIIQGNWIGISATGTNLLGNSNRGIEIKNAANGNIIGGTGTGEGNVIAGNGTGIVIEDTAVGNRIHGNAIYANGGLGIDLGNDGVTLNDANDADAGPNGLQNFPVFTSLISSDTLSTIAGNYHGIANRTYRLEFFGNAPAVVGNGQPQGQVFLGSTNVTTNASGNASFSFSVFGPVAGLFITATATDLTTNNTSEFSNQFDYGDAPAPYPTTLSQSGPRHVAVGPTLGATRDVDIDRQANDGDEDGVIIDGVTNTAGNTTFATVNAPLGGRLDAWFDFNRDGDWNDAGEQIFTNQLLAIGSNIVSFTIPSGTLTGPTWARFRISSAGGLGVTGLAFDGEVEDYQVTVTTGNAAPTDVALNNASIAENAGANEIVGAFITTDPDGGNTHAYTLVPGVGADDNARFQIVGGTLRANAPFDYEAANTYTIRVRSTDQGGLFVERVFTITITDDMPTGVGLDREVRFPANLRADQLLALGVGNDEEPLAYRIVALDLDHDHVIDTLDIDNDGFADGLDRNHDGILDGPMPFVFVGNQLRNAVDLTGLVNAGDIAEIDIRGIDTNGNFMQRRLHMEVLDPIAGPANLFLDNRFIPDLSPAGTFVGTFFTPSVVPGETFTYEFVAGTGDADNTRFVLDAVGQLRTAEAFNGEAGEERFIRVRVTNLNGQSYERDFVIVVTEPIPPGDTPPLPVYVVTPTGGSIEVPEDTAIGNLVYSFPATATYIINEVEITANLVYSIVTGSGKFAIVDDNKLAVAEELDFESMLGELDSYLIRYDAVDSRTGTIVASEEFSFDVAITNVNESPIDVYLDNRSLPENAAAGDVVGTLASWDPDGELDFAFTLLDSAGSRFTLVGNQLVLADHGGSLDFESQTVYTITVQAADALGATVERSFDIHITNANEDPFEITLSAQELAANSADGTLAGSLAVADPDRADTFTYELLNNAGGRFRVSTEGQVAVARGDLLGAGDYEISVLVHDAGGASFAQTFTIHVTGSNSPPDSINLDNAVLDENLPPHALVGVITSSDPDVGDSAVYELVPGFADNALFALNEGTLYFNRTADFETLSSYSIRVRATDIAGLTREQDFTISIRDINEKPRTLNLTNTNVLGHLTIDENAPIGLRLGELSGIDPDFGDTLRYALVQGYGDNTKVSLIGNVLELNTSPNFEEQAAYDIQIAVIDRGGLQLERIFTIDIRDLNEAPAGLVVVGTSKLLASTSNQQSVTALQIADTTPPGTVIATLGVSDQDSGDTVHLRMIDDAGGRFILVGNQLMVAPGVALDVEPGSQFAIVFEGTDSGNLANIWNVDISLSRIGARNLSAAAFDQGLLNAGKQPNRAAFASASGEDGESDFERIGAAEEFVNESLKYEFATIADIEENFESVASENRLTFFEWNEARTRIGELAWNSRILERVAPDVNDIRWVAEMGANATNQPLVLPVSGVSNLLESGDGVRYFTEALRNQARPEYEAIVEANPPEPPIIDDDPPISPVGAGDPEEVGWMAAWKRAICWIAIPVAAGTAVLSGWFVRRKKRPIKSIQGLSHE